MTEKVLRAATCPVLVIRSSQPIRKMLIPLDGSELSTSALAPGLELALRLSAEVTLLRVVDEVSGFERAQLAGLGDTDLANSLQNGLATEAKNYLDRLVTPQPQTGLKLTREVAVSAHPAFRILDYAQRHELDLIVMATHGRTGFNKWVYGSVTERVLCHTPCSMMVIRPARRRLN